MRKATQNREAIAFGDHWKQASGSDPRVLIIDQKAATQPILGEFDDRGVKFATLRMRFAMLACIYVRLPFRHLDAAACPSTAPKPIAGLGGIAAIVDRQNPRSTYASPELTPMAQTRIILPIRRE